MRQSFFGTFSGRALFVLAALAAVAPQGDARAQEEHRLQGGEVSVFTLAGQVEVVPGSGSDVVVQVMRGGDDASKLEIGVREVDGRQALIIRYPDDEVVYPEMGRRSRTTLRVRDDGTFGDAGRGGRHEVEIRGSGGGMEAWADLRISVPRGKDVAVYLAVGEAEVGAVDGDLRIDTGSGEVHAQGGSGSLNIDTGSGEVTVRDFRGDLLVDTGSGAVELSAVQGGEVSVDTGSGAVEGSGVTASYLKVDTGSGRITLSGVSAPDVYLDTGSGPVDHQGPLRSGGGDRGGYGERGNRRGHPVGGSAGEAELPERDPGGWAGKHPGGHGIRSDPPHRWMTGSVPAPDGS
jgi:hypothetical protein